MSSVEIWRCPTTDFVVQWEKQAPGDPRLYAVRQDRDDTDVQVMMFREKHKAYCNALIRSRAWTKKQAKLAAVLAKVI